MSRSLQGLPELSISYNADQSHHAILHDYQIPTTMATTTATTAIMTTAAVARKRSNHLKSLMEKQDHYDHDRFHNDGPQEDNVASLFDPGNDGTQSLSTLESSSDNVDYGNNSDSSANSTNTTNTTDALQHGNSTVSSSSSSFPPLVADELNANVSSLIGINTSDPILKPIFDSLHNEPPLENENENSNTSSTPSPAIPCTSNITTMILRNESTGSVSFGVTLPEPTTTTTIPDETNNEQIESREIDFYYQIEILPPQPSPPIDVNGESNSSNDDKNETDDDGRILQMIESVMSERLIPALFTKNQGRGDTINAQDDECITTTNTVTATTKVRLFDVTSGSDDSPRAAAFLEKLKGFQSLPSDEFLNNVSCVNNSTSTNNSVCHVVNGKVTILFTNKHQALQPLTKDALETIRTNVRHLIDNDPSFLTYLLDKNKRIVNVSYRNITTLPEGIIQDDNHSNHNDNAGRTPVGGTNEENDNGIPIYAWALIGINLLVVLLVVQFIQRRQTRRRQRHLLFEEEHPQQQEDVGRDEELQIVEPNQQEQMLLAAIQQQEEESQQQLQNEDDLSSSYSSSDFSSSLMGGSDALEGDGIIVGSSQLNNNNGLLGIQPHNVVLSVGPLTVTPAITTTTESSDQLIQSSEQQGPQQQQVETNISMSWTDLIASRIRRRTSRTGEYYHHDDEPLMGISPRQPQSSQPREYLIAPSLQQQQQQQQQQHRQTQQGGGDMTDNNEGQIVRLETTWEVLELV